MANNDRQLDLQEIGEALLFRRAVKEKTHGKKIEKKYRLSLIYLIHILMCKESVE